MDSTRNDLYVVVRNDEEEYSIWAAGRAVPAGWEVVGDPRPREECLVHICEIWTDLRPVSLRRNTQVAES
ncbi:MbtH family NRPS accessory protein [Nocardia arthritidis]|uniref:MbtH family NRPS accessory protein n=1 Tax=Nocardia arthritidis TaxID=228602 RepID=UPI00142DA263